MLDSARTPDDQLAAPVFIVGAPRSGTTLLYHILLSTERFARYHTESLAFDLIGPRFRHLKTAAARDAFLEEWTQGFLFERSGFDKEELEASIREHCRGTADFLRILMEGIARRQGVPRWAECTPTHALHLDQISSAFPGARVVHMIRDGRDVALSLARQQWVRPLPLDRVDPRVPAALYWDWIVTTARRQASSIGSAYMEIRFEDLVRSPQKTLDRLSKHIREKLDWQAIQAQGIGTVTKPNTSFSDDAGGFSPVGRWRGLDSEELGRLEQHISSTLHELKYSISPNIRPSMEAVLRRKAYLALFTVKQQLRTKTPLGPLLIDSKIIRLPSPP